MVNRAFWFVIFCLQVLVGTSDAFVPRESRLVNPCYDGNNNRTGMIDGNGHLTTWTFDKENRQTGEQYYTGTFTDFPSSATPARSSSITYDEEGNRVGLDDAKGQHFTYVPDALGREKTAQYPVSSTSHLQQIDRVFDPIDRLDLITSTFDNGPPQTRDPQWNYLSRLVSEDHLSYEYDNNGNRRFTHINLPNQPQRDIEYQYDKHNRLEHVIENGQTTTYHYNCRNEMTQIEHANGTIEDRTYDQPNRLDTITVWQGTPANVLLSYDYDYDAASRKIRQIENHGSGPEETTYGYDDADRLTSASYPDGNTVSWTYDDAGNRSTETTKDSNQQILSDKTYVNDDFNELSSVTDAISGEITSYSYDANGNQIGKSSAGSNTIFHYTSKDELADAEVNGSPVGFYRYDDTGRMIQSGTDLRYWDGHSLVAETELLTGAVKRSYTYGTEVLHGRILGQPVDLYTDGLGSVGFASGASDSAHYRYNAWGGFRNAADCTANPNQLACQNDLTYTGHLFDRSTGLFYFGARWYDQDTGRFLTHDPVAGDALNPPSLHDYLYAWDSPMVYTDPWGEAVDEAQRTEEAYYKREGDRLTWVGLLGPERPAENNEAMVKTENGIGPISGESQKTVKEPREGTAQQTPANHQDLLDTMSDAWKLRSEIADQLDILSEEGFNYVYGPPKTGLDAAIERAVAKMHGTGSSPLDLKVWDRGKVSAETHKIIDYLRWGTDYEKISNQKNADSYDKWVAYSKEIGRTSEILLIVASVSGKPDVAPVKKNVNLLKPLKYNRRSWLGSIYDAARIKVLKRDPKCQYCQVKTSTTADHVVPVKDADAAVGAGFISKEAARKQLHSEENLLGACPSCNFSKKDRLPGNVPGTWKPPNPTPEAIKKMKELRTWDDD